MLLLVMPFLTACGTKEDPLTPHVERVPAASVTDATTERAYDIGSPVNLKREWFGPLEDQDASSISYSIELPFVVHNYNNLSVYITAEILYPDGTVVTCNVDDPRRAPSLSQGRTQPEELWCPSTLKLIDGAAVTVRNE